MGWCRWRDNYGTDKHSNWKVSSYLSISASKRYFVSLIERMRIYYGIRAWAVYEYALSFELPLNNKVRVQISVCLLRPMPSWKESEVRVILKGLSLRWHTWRLALLFKRYRRVWSYWRNGKGQWNYPRDPTFPWRFMACAIMASPLGRPELIKSCEEED